MSNEMIQLLREARYLLHWYADGVLSDPDAGKLRDKIDAALAQAEAEPVTFKRFGFTDAEREAAIEAGMKDRNWPRNPRKAARAGWYAALKAASEQQPAAPAIPKPRVPEELLALIRTFRREVAHLQSLLDGAGLTQSAAPAVLTYTGRQPNNVEALQISRAFNSASPGGDFIDHGLSITQQLERQGFGLVKLAAAPEVK